MHRLALSSGMIMMCKLPNALSLDFAGHWDSGHLDPDEDTHVDISHKYSCLSLGQPSLLLPPQHNFPLSRHIKSALHVHVQCDEYGCDLFLWRLAVRLPPPPPPRHKTSLLNEHSMYVGLALTPAENRHTHTHTDHELIIVDTHK